MEAFTRSVPSSAFQYRTLPLASTVTLPAAGLQIVTLFSSVMHLAPVSLPPIVGSSNGSPKLPPLAGSDTWAASMEGAAPPSFGASDSCAYAGAAASSNANISSAGRLPRLVNRIAPGVIPIGARLVAASALQGLAGRRHDKTANRV